MPRHERGSLRCHSSLARTPALSRRSGSRVRRRSMVRLAGSVIILIITALDFRFGRPGTGLHIAGLTAGVLLALSVIVDRLRRRAELRADGSTAQPDEHLDSKP